MVESQGESSVVGNACIADRPRCDCEGPGLAGWGCGYFHGSGVGGKTADRVERDRNCWIGRRDSVGERDILRHSRGHGKSHGGGSVLALGYDGTARRDLDGIVEGCWWRV